MEPGCRKLLSSSWDLGGSQAFQGDHLLLIINGGKKSFCVHIDTKPRKIGYLEHLDRMGDNNLVPEIPQREKHFTDLPLLAHLYLAVQVGDVLTSFFVISLIKVFNVLLLIY